MKATKKSKRFNAPVAKGRFIRAKWMPTPDESFLEIHYKNLKAVILLLKHKNLIGTSSYRLFKLPNGVLERRFRSFKFELRDKGFSNMGKE